MVITKSMLVSLLNMDIELEYASAIQYATHASLLIRSALYQNIAREVFLDAQEEFQHAMMLANQITHLGGYPSKCVAGIYVSDDERQMLAHDASDEQDSIWRYGVRIEQARQLGEFDLAQQLCLMMEMEKEHEEDFQQAQTLRPRERGTPILDIIESDFFEEKWQERALHVPVRKRVNDA